MQLVSQIEYLHEQVLLFDQFLALQLGAILHVQKLQFLLDTLVVIWGNPMSLFSSWKIAHSLGRLKLVTFILRNIGSRRVNHTRNALISVK